MFDSHCHLQDSPLYDDWRSVLAEAQDQQVDYLLLAGENSSTWGKQLDMKRVSGAIFVAVGLHPYSPTKMNPDEIEAELAQLQDTIADAGTNISALGEIGLDRSGGHKDSIARQQDLLVRQLALASDAKLPVIFHVVQAHGMALDLLTEHKAHLGCGGIIHSFTGSPEVAERYLELGLHVSFSGSVCNPQAKKIRQAAADIPSERLLIETDAPYQAPKAIDGIYTPAHLPIVASEMAKIRGQSFEEIASITERNGLALLQHDD